METLPFHDSFMRKSMWPTPHSSRSNIRSSKQLVMPSFGLAVVLLLCLASPASSCTEQEKSSLLGFLAELSQDGGLAVSWQNDTDCCAWQGIICDRNGAVIEVSLASRGLEGPISPSIGDLAGLLRINMSLNSFTGGLPLEVMSSGSIVVLDVSFNRLNGVLQDLNLSASDRPLQVLNISSNLFTGEFPSTAWEKTRNLVALNASNNSFNGLMPSSFCINSQSLVVLDLSYNQFSGNIPPGLGNCSMLRVLKVGHNGLNGTLSDELFNATLLEHLSFPSNGLEGTFGGVVELSNLITLDLGWNYFSGKIPDSIGLLKRLEELHLDHNYMFGELPSTLGNCTNLITIDLKINNFSGELAKVNFSTLPNLKVLDLLFNNFTGSIPESIYSCSNMTALRLSGNHLHGQFSPRIGNMKSLTFLSLGTNNFTNITNALQILKGCKNLTTLLINQNFGGEVMPDDDRIDGFENLQVLQFSDCPLFGKIPLWISKLGNLEMLVLYNNQLTGPVPDWISSLNFLFYLDISNNNLTGEIPIALMDMPMLKSEKNTTHLDPRVFKLPVYASPSHQYRIPTAYPKVLKLGSNKFTGKIPPEIGQLKSLLTLNLSFNDLTGQIPQSICSLTNLQVLDLSNNNLTGAIPAALDSLHFLSTFNISNNDLEGPLPSGGQFNTFQNSSFDGNPKLCGSTLIHKCGSAKAPPATVLSTEETNCKVVFVVAFSMFFGVGVLYDQIVLSRFFGEPYVSLHTSL